MNRKTFLQSLTLLPVAMNLREFGNTIQENAATDKMPVLFVGHGNPMNAITDNIYSRTWREVGAKLAPPKAILVISAHWLTRGTSVAVTDKPKTIHDFGGFPDELFRQQYPAPGAPDYARMAKESIHSAAVHEDSEWGLDHGAWSVLMHMYPKANIPVFQMSIDYSRPPEYHFNLAKELAFLRTRGVLIVASGNVVHNLRRVKWSGEQKPYDWAIEFDQLVQQSIEKNNPAALTNFNGLGELGTLAHPTYDHYLPLMYTLGLRDAHDRMEFFNNAFDMGSISMKSVIFS